MSDVKLGELVRNAGTRVIATVGAVVGVVLEVRDHPNGRYIWLARISLGTGEPYQVVFGGTYRLRPGELVPAAPPGSRVTVAAPGLALRVKKMRNRRYRGERSHGMLCSLVELGWAAAAPDEVAVLRDLPVGLALDGVPPELRVDVVAPRLAGWVRADVTDGWQRDGAASR